MTPEVAAALATFIGACSTFVLMAGVYLFGRQPPKDHHRRHEDDDYDDEE